MNRIKALWGRGASGKLLVILGGLIVLCCACIGLGLVLPRSPQPASAPAAQFAPASAFTPGVTLVAKAIATAAPTETPVPPTAAPSGTAEPTIAPSSAPAFAPTEAPIAPAPTDAPAVAPTSEPLQEQPTLSPDKVTPTFSDGAGGPNARVTPAWWPCRQGQIKGNLNSMIYHTPRGRDYSKTFENVRCFDTTDEASAAGFRAAKQ